MSRPTEIRRRPPEDPEQLRRRVYDGEIFLFPSTPESMRLVDDLTALVEASFGPEPRLAHERLSDRAIFRAVGALRRRLFEEPRFHHAVLDVVESFGLAPNELALDPPKLRCIQHLGHENDAAAAAYYPHRDTWYGHPQALITWWTPLHDLEADETFVFYPDRFTAPVPNDSHSFDYDEWTSDERDLRVGWQDPTAGEEVHYPGVVGTPELGRALGFSCKRGESLVFSGSHFHGTLRQATGRTRFSIDFRIVHLEDAAASLGAPNVDNRSRGDALVDYLRYGAS